MPLLLRSRIAVFVSLLLALHSCAQSPEELLEAIWQCREEVVSGDVTIRANRERSLASDCMELRLIFDRAAGASRCDRRNPENGPLEQIVRSRSKTIIHISGTGVASIHGATYELPHNLLGPPDIRVVGPGGFLEFITSYAVPDFRAALSSGSSIQAKSIGSDLKELRWDFDLEGLKSKRITQVDLSKGFLPVQHSSEVCPLTPDNPTNSYFPQYTETIKWRFLNGVAVPVRCIGEYTGAPMTLDLHWQTVNEDVDPRLFEIEGLDLPNGTIIANYQTGQKVIQTVIDAVTEGNGIDLRMSTAAGATSTTGIKRYKVVLRSVAIFCLILAIVLGVVSRVRNSGR